MSPYLVPVKRCCPKLLDIDQELPGLLQFQAPEPTNESAAPSP
jgi:hypothetical protein